MFAASIPRLAATATAAAAAAASSVGVGGTQLGFEQWLAKSGAKVDNVLLRPSADQCRGLVARKRIRPGQPVVSIPLDRMSINAATLMKSPRVEKLLPPSHDTVKETLILFGVNDPGLVDQFHLALLIAAERCSPDSPFAPYFDSLPHPAVDDASVMRIHKDFLDAEQLLEWDDHQRVFVSVMRKLRSKWGAAAPPEQIVYWAWRTVLSRQLMMPNRGLAKEEAKLNFQSLFTLNSTDYTLGHRLSQLWTSVTKPAEVDFRLVPTLVPVVDMVSHNSSGNVSIEVYPRPELGSCAELQAIADIREGENITICFSRVHSIPFTLYRFGFLPV